MPLALLLQIRYPTDQIEVPSMPVQVTRDHRLLGIRRGEENDITFASGRRAVDFSRLLKGGDDLFDVFR